MPRFTISASFLMSLLLAACSQPPAVVELKGQNTYGRSSFALNNSMPVYSYGHAASNTPAPYTTPASNVMQSTSVQPTRLGEASRITNDSTQQADGAAWVGVHDLAALSPAAGSAPPPVTPFAAATSPQVSATSAPINSWTNRPHFSDAKSAPASQDKPIAQLDRVIGNDGDHTHPARAAKAQTAANAAFMWPVSGKKVISGFGPKGGGKTNDGINIAAGEGEPVWASADGEIIYVGNELQGYGNMVLIKHPGNKTTAYAHLSRATVDKYDRVKQGDIIGYVGSTGNVKEPQLHFALRYGKEPVDPQKYLSSNVAAN